MSVTVPRRLPPIIILLLLLVLAGSARAATPVVEPPATIAGPSASIHGLSGLSVARDGSGGLVYLESVNGAEHVFVSVLSGGGFVAPVEVDAALGAGSSQPVIAAGNGGLLLIAFINAGQLYVVSRATSSAPFSAPQDMYNGAINPSIELSIQSEGYLAFTVADGGGYDVRDLYYYAGQWQLESGALNLTAADDAGTGTGDPQVAAAGDGEAIVVWGENGHVYARRVWYGMTSYEVEQADVPSLGGLSEVSADSPVVAVGDNSSYTDVAFREQFTNGLQTVSRVLLNRLVGSEFQGAFEADGQPLPGGSDAAAPGIVMMQYGNGFTTSELEGSNQVWATVMRSNGIPNSAQRIDSLPDASSPYPTSAIAGDYTGLIAWQHDPGLLGLPEIRARSYSDFSFSPEMVVSNPSLGPTNAAEGLFAGGDHGGDVAIAYVQGSGSATVIEVTQLVYPPGSFGVAGGPAYRTTARPTLAWSAPRELWGPLQYDVTIDGALAGQTSATTFTPPAALSQGPHTLQVTAVNVHGLTSAANPASFFVDSIPPVGQLTVTGAERVFSLLHLRVRYTDAPAPLPSADSSGIAGVVVSWGDGTSNRIRRQTATHRYGRAGRYSVTVTLTDRAGNRTVLSRRLQIQ